MSQADMKPPRPGREVVAKLASEEHDQNQAAELIEELNRALAAESTQDNANDEAA